MKIGTTTLATITRGGKLHLVLLELQEYDQQGVPRFYPVYTIDAPENWNVRKRKESSTGEWNE